VIPKKARSAERKIKGCSLSKRRNLLTK